MRLTTESTLLLAVLAAAGCGKTPEPIYPVEGIVRVGGRPLKDGTIQFEMIERGTSGKRYTSTSTIDPDGRYRLRTFERDGAPAGRHRVWVSPNFAAMPDEIGTSVFRLSPIPRKYMQPTTTDLEYEVKTGDNEIVVDVPAESATASP
jgi:hypothetical protein